MKLSTVLLYTLALGASACGITRNKSPSSLAGKNKEAKAHFGQVSAQERVALLKKARVWDGSLEQIQTLLDSGKNAESVKKDIAARKVVVGERHPGEESYGNNELIVCTYREPVPEEKSGGYSPKYSCETPDGKVLKIKYDESGRLLADKEGTIRVPGIPSPTFKVTSASDLIPNLEVYAEVAGSTFLSMLGFETDRNYPVRVLCTNCPSDPFSVFAAVSTTNPTAQLRVYRAKMTTRELLSPAPHVERLPRGRFYFPNSIIEVKNPGLAIEQKSDDGSTVEGFSLAEYLKPEFLSDDPQTRKLQLIEREAYALIVGGMLQHADAKEDNQRLICPRDKVVATGDAARPFDCSEPKLFVHDIGWSFGDGRQPRQINSLIKMHLGDWRKVHVFADAKNCIVNVNHQFSSNFVNFPISEEARAFASTLLAGLTDAQIEGLFKQSKIEDVDHGALSTLVKTLCQTGSVGVATSQAARCLMTSTGSPKEWAEAFKAKRKLIAETKCSRSVGSTL